MLHSSLLGLAVSRLHPLPRVRRCLFPVPVVCDLIRNLVSSAGLDLCHHVELALTPAPFKLGRSFGVVEVAESCSLLVGRPLLARSSCFELGSGSFAPGCFVLLKFARSLRACCFISKLLLGFAGPGLQLRTVEFVLYEVLDLALSFF